MWPFGNIRTLRVRKCKTRPRWLFLVIHMPPLVLQSSSEKVAS